MNVATLKANLSLDDRDFQRGLIAADARLRGFGTGIKRTEDDLRRFGNRLRDTGEAIRSVGVGATIGLTIPIMGLGREAIKTYTNLDALKRGLGAITKESGPLSNQLGRLRELSKLPGLGFEDAIRGSVRLQSANLSAKEAETTIKQLANAITLVGGTSEDLNRVSLALSQVQSAGKLMGDELRQLQEPLPQVRQALIQAFGTANTEILAAAEITSEEFIDKFTKALEKLPRAQAGPKVEFEKGAQEMRLALGEIGAEVTPVAAKILKDLVPVVKQTVEFFKGLPDPVKMGTLALVGLTAAFGPAAIALGTAILTWGQLNRLIAANTALLAANTGAAAAAGGAQAAAALGGAGKYAAGAAAAGFGLNNPLVTALATGAAGTIPAYGSAPAPSSRVGAPPIGAVKGGILGRAGAAIKGLGWRGVLGRLGVAGAVGAAGLWAGSTIGEAVGIGGLGNMINPAKDAGPLAADAGKMGSALRKRNIIKRIAAQQGISEEEARKQFEGARGAGVAADKGAITARTAPNTGDTPTNPNDLAVNRAPFKKAAREAELEAIRAEGEAKASAAPSETNARAMFKNVAPILREQMAELLSQEKALEGEAKNNAVKAKELFEIRKARFRMQEELGNLERAANDEIKQQQDKEKAEQKRRIAEAERREADLMRAGDLAFDASVAMARANLGPEREGRVQREATTVIPMLESRAKELEAQAANLLPRIKGNAELTEQYYEWLNQAATLRQEAGNIESRALSEQAEITKRQEREAKKRLEDQKKNFGDWQDTFSLRAKLVEEQLKNDPFLSKQQRGEMMLPSLREAYGALSMDVPGETPKEAMQRLLERERVKGDIVEALGARGKGSTAKVLGGGIMPYGFDPRRLSSEMSMLDQIGRQAEKSQYGNNVGVDANITVNANAMTAPWLGQQMNTPEFRAAFERWYAEYMANQAKAVSQRRVNF